MIALDFVLGAAIRCEGEKRMRVANENVTKATKNLDLRMN